MTRQAPGLRAATLMLASAAAPALADGGVTDPVVAQGQRHFEAYCAVCHGLGARGDGPFAGLLRTRPPDLTLLARRNGGSFPFARVWQVIDGRDSGGAHGTREMPIWGRAFSAQQGGPMRELYVHGRILELIVYLDAIQRR